MSERYMVVVQPVVDGVDGEPQRIVGEYSSEYVARDVARAEAKKGGCRAYLLRSVSSFEVGVKETREEAPRDIQTYPKGPRGPWPTDTHGLVVPRGGE